MFAVDDDADNEARNNLNIETPNANAVELENVNNDENNVSDRIEEVIDPVTALSDNVESTNDLNTTSDDFVEERVIKESRTSPKETTKKKTKGKKRKAAESIESTDSEEGSVCTICFEDWSNSGDHRIASLKCGHFFGYSCIDKWLRGSGNACPNCNEKNTKKDIRVHFVAKLAAIDTSERDRAIQDLETTRSQFRELEMRHTELSVRSKMQQEKIDQLEACIRRYRERGGELPPTSIISNIKIPAATSDKGFKFVYVRRHEVCRPSNDRDKCCRVLAVSDYQGMIIITQPSANPLFPGFGARRFNMLDQKLGNFVGLGKDVIRDVSFHPVTPELLLSCGQEKVVRVTNMVSCNEVVRFTTEHEPWACDWSLAGSKSQLYIGTKKSQILVYDTLQPSEEPVSLQFPVTEYRPICGLVSVPPDPSAGLVHPGFLVLTLGSLWYWEHNPADQSYRAHKLVTPPGKMFWSLRYDASTRLILLVCRPAPLTTHIVMELVSAQLDSGRAMTTNTIMTVEGASYKERSFLRSCLLVLNKEEGRVMLAYTRGTGVGDIKIVIQEVPTARIVQEIGVGKPVLDIKTANINDQLYLALLCETELIMHKLHNN